jgi:hypothetical protein
MNHPTNDTSWSTSAKGNEWRRLNEKVLVVGQKKNGTYWAMFNGDFIEGEFESESNAKKAAEQQCAKELKKQGVI